MSRGDMLKKPCTDHLGNSYDSITSMCEAYGINPVTFSKRIQRGKTLEQALTEPVRSRVVLCQNVNRVTDADDNGFSSVSAMCKHYDMDYTTYVKRRESGMSKKEALAVPKQTHRPCEDHLGNQFKSTADMCRYYGMDYSVYQNRIRIGWSVKDALTTKLRNRQSNKVCHTVYHSYKLIYLGNSYIVYATSPHEAIQRWELFKGYLNPQPCVDILELKPGTEIHDYCTII
ncbi:hypothetical protein RUMCAL_00308 [Ruminococcus callidus ATCC 27760]|jgi:hypothetical protein|uniref:Uncharacterized protein n=1 Tax=Ruminococcus callidus ATCC 27760 TaxID=411473 RepID=U2KFD1_9FIRM|nr:hypothetical protein [Ruminococcus callidus]ERJ97236.1 hypothetical protein RUMCAL_00308 [Ruminococcus callidus ATCC 27760]